MCFEDKPSFERAMACGSVDGYKFGSREITLTITDVRERQTAMHRKGEGGDELVLK